MVIYSFIFMYDYRYYDAQRTLIFSPSFKLFQSCPPLKVVHVYQNFLEQNSKVPSTNEPAWSAMCETQLKDFVTLIVISILVNKVVMV